MLAGIALLRRTRTDRSRQGRIRISLDNLVEAVTACEADYLAFGRRPNALYENTSEVSKKASSLMGRTMGERLNAQIGGLGEEPVSLPDRIEGEGDILSSEIMSSARSIHFNEKIMRAIDNLVGGIDAACLKMESGLIRKRMGEGFEYQGMEEVGHRYTMQKERDVHKSVLGLPTTYEWSDLVEPEMDQQKTAGEEREEDLGENVELF